MSRLADLSEIIGFFSYSRDDDESYRGRLSALRESIQHELSAQLGRSRTSFRLWQDREAIAPGRLWEAEIKTAVAQSVFFIPIVTPRAVNSEYCRFEFDAFLARERELGRADLVFPVLYVPVPALQDEAEWRGHPVLSTIAARQYVDWQMFRHVDSPTHEMRLDIAKFCHTIVEALRRSWLTPEERRLQEQAAAERRAEEERNRRQAEAKRLAEEAARKQKEEEDARRRAEAEAAAFAALARPFTPDALRGFLREHPEGANAATAKAELDAFVRVESALDQARRIDGVGAVDAFLATHPGSHLAAEALKLRDSIVARQSAYAAAIANDDPALLKSFVDRWPQCDEAKDVQRRLDAIARDEAYRRAMMSEDAAPLEDFLAAHAEDKRAPEVRARLRKIKPPILTRRRVLIGGGLGAAGAVVALAVVDWKKPAPTPPVATMPASTARPPIAAPALVKSVPRLASTLTIATDAQRAVYGPYWPDGNHSCNISARREFIQCQQWIAHKSARGIATRPLELYGETARRIQRRRQPHRDVE